MNTKKAVAYYRVSTQKQGESGFGLDAQQKAVSQFTYAYNIQVVQEFVEIESGKKSNRPLLNKALLYCQNNQTTLVIAKLDRLGRNVAFISALMESKVDFVAVDNPHASRFLLHILAAVAEYESDLISTRTREALQAAKRRGVKLGANGAALAEKHRKEAMELAIKMKPVIEKLNKRGIKSTRKIAKALNKKGVPSLRKKRWHATTVFHLLKRIKALNQ